MIQRAVKRNSKAPVFSGLESFLVHCLDGSAGIVASDFDRYIAEVQKVDANILKQQRLTKEESDAVAKAKNN